MLSAPAASASPSESIYRSVVVCDEGQWIEAESAWKAHTGEMSPMAKCRTTNAGHARCGRRLATVSGFGEGVRQGAHYKDLTRIRDPLKERRLASYEMDGDVGWADAKGAADQLRQPKGATLA